MEGLKQERFIVPSADTIERSGLAGRARARKAAAAFIVESLGHAELARIDDLHGNNKIGRASWRERVCQYVENSVVAVSIKKKKSTMEIESPTTKKHTYYTRTKI